jgi:hypothetical protein
MSGSAALQKKVIANIVAKMSAKPVPKKIARKTTVPATPV